MQYSIYLHKIFKHFIFQCFDGSKATLNICECLHRWNSPFKHSVLKDGDMRSITISPRLRIKGVFKMHVLGSLNSKIA